MMPTRLYTKESLLQMFTWYIKCVCTFVRPALACSQRALFSVVEQLHIRLVSIVVGIVM